MKGIRASVVALVFFLATFCGLCELIALVAAPLGLAIWCARTPRNLLAALRGFWRGPASARSPAARG